MLALLGDQHPQLRRFLPQLAREAAAGKPTTQNRDIDAFHGPTL
jgi:hypothetical protein